MTRKQYTEEDSEETEEDDGMLLTKKPAKRATAKKNVSTSPFQLHVNCWTYS